MNAIPIDIDFAYYQDEALYGCPYCGYSFRHSDTKFKLNDHKYDNGRTFICPECKKEFIMPR
jgi:uncharacterized Zn ribbon protein